MITIWEKAYHSPHRYSKWWGYVLLLSFYWGLSHFGTVKKQWYYSRKITHLGGKERVELWDTMKAMWKRNNALPGAKKKGKDDITYARWRSFIFILSSAFHWWWRRPTSFLLRFLSKRSREKSRNAQVLLYYWGTTSANILQHLPKMVQS